MPNALKWKSKWNNKSFFCQRFSLIFLDSVKVLLFLYYCSLWNDIHVGNAYIYTQRLKRSHFIGRFIFCRPVPSISIGDTFIGAQELHNACNQSYVLKPFRDNHSGYWDEPSSFQGGPKILKNLGLHSNPTDHSHLPSITPGQPPRSPWQPCKTPWRPQHTE